MTDVPTTPEARYAATVESLLRAPGVTHDAAAEGSRKFGAGALKTDGRIFAMLAHGRLVVKLPRKRVDALVLSGDGEHFDPGHGRRMKEWLSLDPASEQDWASLAREALEFVGGKAP